MWCIFDFFFNFVYIYIYIYIFFFLADMTARVAERENLATNPPIGEIFAKNYAKLYIPVVSLSTGDDNKLLQQLKSEFKRTVKWNKYISEMNN